MFAAVGLYIIGSVLFEVRAASKAHREIASGCRAIAAFGWLLTVTGYGMMGACYIASSYYHATPGSDSDSLAMSVINLLIVGIALIWAAPNLGSRRIVPESMIRSRDNSES